MAHVARRLFADKANGKIMGVCAGFAVFSGFNVNIVRGFAIAAIFGTMPLGLVAYFCAGFFMANAPVDIDRGQSVSGHRSLPRYTEQQVRIQYAKIERRLAAIETHYTMQNNSLSEEIESLRDHHDAPKRESLQESYELASLDERLAMLMSDPALAAAPAYFDESSTQIQPREFGRKIA